MKPKNRITPTIYRYRENQLRPGMLVTDPFTNSIGEIVQVLGPRVEWNPESESYRVKKILIRAQEVVCTGVLVRVLERGTGSHHKISDMVPWQIPVAFEPGVYLTPEQEVLQSYRRTMPDRNGPSKHRNHHSPGSGNYFKDTRRSNTVEAIREGLKKKGPILLFALVTASSIVV